MQGVRRCSVGRRVGRRRVWGHRRSPTEARRTRGAACAARGHEYATLNLCRPSPPRVAFNNKNAPSSAAVSVHPMTMSATWRAWQGSVAGVHGLKAAVTAAALRAAVCQ